MYCEEDEECFDRGRECRRKAQEVYETENGYFKEEQHKEPAAENKSQVPKCQEPDADKDKEGFRRRMHLFWMCM